MTIYPLVESLYLNNLFRLYKWLFSQLKWIGDTAVSLNRYANCIYQKETQ